MTKKDASTLWEQEGDLERMRLFFKNVDPNLEQKERIKQRALEKIRKEEDQFAHLGTSNTLTISEISGTPGTESNTFRRRICRRIKSLCWRLQWKLAIPAVALVFMIFIGQAGIDGFLDFPLGQKEKAAQSQGMNQDTAKLYDMAGSVSSKAAGPTTSAEDTREFGTEAPPSTAITPILLQPEPQTPPADESLPRKITYNMNANLQVEDVNLALDQITQKVQSRGGYVVESSQDQYQNNSSAYVKLKIPSSQLEGFRGLLPDVGKVLNQHTTANDITNQYYDAETRLRSWEGQEARYLEILREAQSVEDILQIESYLGNIRMQIEQLKGQLKLWEHEVSYSTISLNLQTTPNIVDVNDPWQPVTWAKTWQAAKGAVLKTLSSTWNGLNYFIVGIAYGVPYLILGAVFFGVYKGIRRYRR